MKRISVIVFLLVLISNMVNGQDYKPMIDTAKQWNILQHQYEDDSFSNLRYINTIGERFKGDTLINGMHYSYLETCKNDSTFKNWQRSFYLFREDSINGKVYVYNNDHEILIYDFSLNVGDTLNIYNQFIVDSVKTEFIANANRKIIYFGNACESLAIIEGIGTYYDILEPLYRCSTGGSVYDQLICFSKNSEILFQSGENCYEYMDYTYISDFLNDQSVLVFPNPVSNKLNIKSKNDNKNANISIYSLDSRLVISDIMNGNYKEITINELQNGLYILRITKEDDNIQCEKIIINKNK